VKPLSKEIRLLDNKWRANQGWPKRLESIEIKGLRGWTGQKLEFRFPIIAICGENGSGKSTILQAAASIYGPPRGRKGKFASDFFRSTKWDHIEDASIRAVVREGSASRPARVSKLTERWRGNPDRPLRAVEYLDLTRTQPITSRVGFLQLADPNLEERGSDTFDETNLRRLADIMGRPYSTVRMSLTSAHPSRRVPIVEMHGSDISGFHQGAGELTVAELLVVDPPDNSLVLIDEVETSLHPRAQRRLIRDLAEICRKRELQVIMTTHSPYILQELPPEARGYILRSGNSREVIFGVSPDFAMTKMDEDQHPECDLYVEDARAEDMLREILVVHAPEEIVRCQVIRYGAASVGKALGQMVEQRRFPRRSVVFVDGDQSDLPGCVLLPGGDAPERVVFEALQMQNWGLLHERTGRPFSQVADACSKAMTGSDHHEWVAAAANEMLLGGNTLWPAMCSEWAKQLSPEEVAPIISAVVETLELGSHLPRRIMAAPEPAPAEPIPSVPEPVATPNPVKQDQERLETFQRSLFDA